MIFRHFIILAMLASCSTTSKNSTQLKATSDCIADANRCDMYQCLEDQYKCGSDGYILDNGKRYCQKYLELCPNSRGQPTMHSENSSDGARMSAFACKKTLNTVNTKPAISCEEIRDVAWEIDHVECYLNPLGYRDDSISFCALNFLEVSTIAACVRLKDSVSVRGATLGQVLSARCIERGFGLEF
ncbi:MAG: hypothetical protein R3B45_11875 [Bdellovibrionota bacterium]